MCHDCTFYFPCLTIWVSGILLEGVFMNTKLNELACVCVCVDRKKWAAHQPLKPDWSPLSISSVAPLFCSHAEKQQGIDQTHSPPCRMSVHNMTAIWCERQKTHTVQVCVCAYVWRARTHRHIGLINEHGALLLSVCVTYSYMLAEDH